MGSDNLFWKHKSRKSDIERKKAYKKSYQTFLIICEGEKTEPNYFKSFPVVSARVEVKGTGRNTDSLVVYALETLKARKEEYADFDQIWVVFDKDSFKDKDFNRAIELAESNKIKIAYSNEAFELWYILHFEYLCTGMTRDQYIDKLSKLLKHPYKKNSHSIYQEIACCQQTAIRNAKNLLENHHPQAWPPAKKKPSTTVHLLVEELLKYIKK